MSGHHEKRVLLLILAAAFLLFAPSLWNGFALDDVPLVQSVAADGSPKPAIAGLKEPWWYFGQRYWAGTANASIEYRPVTVLSYALTYNLISAPFLPAGAEALPHHAINVLLHVLAVFLLWRWLKDLGAGATFALTTAGAFALCAIHSETVAGIVGRAELLATVSGFLALRQFDRGRPVWAGVLLFLAFCSKESALAFAPFLFCHLLAKKWMAGEPATLVRIGRVHGAALAQALLPALVLFFVLRQVAIADVAEYVVSHEQNPLKFTAPGPRILTGVALLGLGFVKSLVPFPLLSLYGPGTVAVLESPLAPGFLAALLGLGGWLGAALWLRRRQPLLFLAATTFLGFAFITSNLPLAIGTIFAERLYYTPSLGVCLLAALVATAPRPGSLARRLAMGALLAAGIVHAAVILTRNGAWRDSATLFRTDAARAPESAVLQNLAGFTLLESAPEQAQAHFERALAADPDYSGAWANLATLQARKDDLDGAEQSLRRALAGKYVLHSGSHARIAEGLIRMLLQRGRWDAAMTVAKETLAAAPDHYYARLALLDLSHGRLPPEEYGRMLEEAARRYPGDPRFELRRHLLAYELGRRKPGDAPMLAGSLQGLLGALPPHERNEAPGVRARLYLGELLVEAGRSTEARSVLGELLRDPTLSAGVRARVQAALAKAR